MINTMHLELLQEEGRSSVSCFCTQICTTQCNMSYRLYLYVYVDVAFIILCLQQIIVTLTDTRVVLFLSP